MSSKIFKQSLSVSIAMAAIAFADGAFAVLGAGIPVYCYNCEEGSSNAAHAILDGMRLQTEALLNARDYTMRTGSSFDTAIASATGVTQQRIKNAYNMDPSIAKPRLACSQVATSGVRSASSGGTASLRRSLIAKTTENNYRGANLPPGESRKEYSVTNVIEVLGDEEASPAEVLMSQAPIANNTATINRHRKIKDATVNPFPVELPPEEEIKRIKTRGSQGEREGLAQMYALMARQISAQSITDDDEANRIQFIPSDPFKDQLSYITEGMDDETKALWSTGKLSNYQLDKLGASYRALSPTWIKQTSTNPSEIGLLREIALELAELLHQTGQSNKILREGNILQALKESREASRDGLRTR